MAVNKNKKLSNPTEKNLDTSDNKSVTRSSFEDNFTEVNTNSIKIAQALNNNEINSIQSDANLDLLAPSEAGAVNIGAPIEADAIEEIISETQEQNISPDFFESTNENGLPEEVTVNNIDEDINVSDIVISPEESLSVGAPSQVEGQNDSLDELSQNNNTIGPQEVNNLAESSPEELATPNSQLELPIDQEVVIQSLPPEEIILNSQPEEGLAEISETETDSDNSNNIGPIASEVAGAPNETVTSFNQNIISEDLDTSLAVSPSLAENLGGPAEDLVETNEIEVATNNIAPIESFTDGNPIQLERVGDNNINTENEVIETAQLLPQQEEEGGMPQQAFSENNISEELEIAGISPEQSESAGVPQEDTVEVEESIQLAELEEIEPQEGNTQDYIDTVLQNKLSESIEKGLSPQEAAVAAIEAGREAIKESASSPEEIKEYADNLSETLINQINNKIEDIESDIKETEVPTDVAQATEETEVPTDVAQATEETEVPTDVAQATEETEVPTDVAQATEETEVPTDVAQATEETEVPTDVAQATEETEVPTDVAQATLDNTTTFQESIDSNIIISSNLEDLSLSESSIDQIETMASLSSDNEESEEVETEESFEEDTEDTEDIQDTSELASVSSSLPLADESFVISEQLGENSVGLNLNSTGSFSLVSSSINPSASFTTINTGLGNVSSLGSVNILGGVPNLGQQSIGSLELNSVLGSDTSSSDSDISEDVTEEEGEVIFNEPEEEEVEEEVAEEEVAEEVDFTTISNASIINPTSEDDVIQGGTATNEFNYDFSNYVGGNDTLSDIGTSTDDRILFKNIPDNYSIFISKDPDKNEMRIETFNTETPTPTNNSNSINTINTPISDGETGIENIYFTTENDNYNATETVPFENFFTIGASDINSKAQVITGSTSNDVYYSTVETGDYLYRFSDHSDYYRGNNSELGSISTTYPYDNTSFHLRGYFTKEGNDTLSITDNVDTIYLANMGSGDDTIQMPSDNTIGAVSYLNGGDGTDSLDFFSGNNHLGFNSSNYEDSILESSSSILSQQGTSSNIGEVDHAYFKNFEEIQLGLGEDSVYFAGDPGNNIEILAEAGNDTFNFDYALTSNVTATGGSGADTFNIKTSPNTGILNLKGGAGVDNYNFSSNISSTITAGGGDGNDMFKFDSASITGDLTITSGTGNDVFKFNTVNNGSGINIDDYTVTNDTFSFNSAAFAGSEGHVLVFGHVMGTEFMPDSTDMQEYFFLDAYNATNTQVNDLLSIDNDYWYYDTTDGNLFYDQDADQEMTDAITIAKVTDSDGNALDKTEILSSELDYFTSTTSS